MVQLPLDQSIPRFKENEERFHDFTNGDQAREVTTSTGAKIPSLRKFLYDKNAEINTGISSILAQVTEKVEEAEDAKDAAAGSANAAAASAAAAATFDPSTYYPKTAIDENFYNKGAVDGKITTVNNSIANVLTTVNSYYALIASLQSNVSTLALTLADLNNQLLRMKGGVSDPYDNESGINRGTPQGLDANTLSLFHFDGLTGKVTLKDEGWMNYSADVDSPYLWNPRGTGMFLDTSQSKFGTSSMRFSGAATPGFFTGTGHADFNFAGDFTIDFRLRLNAINLQQTLLDFRSGSSVGHALSVGSDNRLIFVWAGAVRITGATALAANQWYHVTLQRTGGNVIIALEGVQEGVPYALGAGAMGVGTVGPIIGADLNAGNILNGWIDELRISKVARWTLPFTPPTAPYSGASGTTTAKVIYDAINGFYRPADKKNLIHVQYFEAAVNSQERSDRVLIPSRKIGESGAYVRFRMNFGSGATLTIKQAHIGQKAASGNPWDFASAPTQITFNGGQTSLVYAGTPVWSDWILLNIDNTKDYIFAFDHTAGGTWLYSTTANDQAIASKAGSQLESNVVAPTGYTNFTGQSLGPDMIQVRPDATPSEPMVLESIGFVAGSVPPSGRMTVQIDGLTPAITPDVDLIAEMTRDGGVTWMPEPLSLAFMAGNIRQYEGAASLDTQPSGTSMKYRIRTPTGKTIKVTGANAAWA